MKKRLRMAYFPLDTDAQCAWDQETLPNPGCRYPGAFIDLAIFLIRHFAPPHSQVELAKASSFSAGDFTNSTSMYGLMYKNEADMTPPFVLVDPKRFDAFAMLPPLFYEAPAIIYRRPIPSGYNLEAAQILRSQGTIRSFALIFVWAAHYRLLSLVRRRCWISGEHFPLVLGFLSTIILQLVDADLAKVFNAPLRVRDPIAESPGGLIRALELGEYRPLFKDSYWERRLAHYAVKEPLRAQGDEAYIRLFAHSREELVAVGSPVHYQLLARRLCGFKVHYDPSMPLLWRTAVLRREAKVTNQQRAKEHCDQ